ncbi:hypothetical protein [Seonamhaeicola maritimus]|uniref:hypothetical protein n=1 Tax=Seonamhaeicola maritimus TaxID=2591822 RepID=UPI002494D3F0|nr:hypothetical protein [Seonamhaeicola maritimus]
MKKITLLFVLLFSITFLGAQSSLNISHINGMTPADFETNHNKLVEGETLTLKVEYTNVLEKSDWGCVCIRTRLLSEWNVVHAPSAPLGSSYLSETTVTTDTNTQTIDINMQVPDVVVDYGDTIRIFVVAEGTTSSISANTDPQRYLLNDELSLSTENFNKNKLNSFYSVDRDAVVIKDRLEGGYSIYNLMGQEVLEGKILGEISVSTLKTGLYILSTEYGALKFAK